MPTRTETKHTPGPHRAEGVEIYGPDGLIGSVGFGMRDDTEMLANAKLYAAAVDLLTACESAIGYIEYIAEKFENELRGDHTKAYVEITDAIAKATGEAVREEMKTVGEMREFLRDFGEQPFKRIFRTDKKVGQPLHADLLARIDAIFENRLWCDEDRLFVVSRNLGNPFMLYGESDIESLTEDLPSPTRNAIATWVLHATPGKSKRFWVKIGSESVFVSCEIAGLWHYR